MINGNEAADQIVRYTLEGAEIALKLTGSAAKNAAIFLAAILKDTKKTRGKTNVTHMLRENAPLKFFQVPTDQLKRFALEAKQYGLLFVAMRKRTDTAPLTDVMVFARDASKVNRIMDKLALGVVDTGALEADILGDKKRGTGANFTKAGEAPSKSSSRSNSDWEKERSTGGSKKSVREELVQISADNKKQIPNGKHFQQVHAHSPSPKLPKPKVR